MKCYICNGTLASDEIKHTPEHGHGDFGPCGTCNQIIDEVFEHPSEEEVDRQLLVEFYEILQEDNDTPVEEGEEIP